MKVGGEKRCGDGGGVPVRYGRKECVVAIHLYCCHGVARGSCIVSSLPQFVLS